MTQPKSLIALLRGAGRQSPSLGWPRIHLDEDGWRRLRAGLAGGGLDLVALWGEPGTVHAAVREGPDAAIFTLGCGKTGAYPALGQMHPPAIRLERAVRD